MHPFKTLPLILLGFLSVPSQTQPVLAQDATPIEIGDRRELFVDQALVDQLDGVVLSVQQPTPQEVVLVTDQPWEGNTSAYYTIFQDGDRYRMYYRGSHWIESSKKAAHREVVCYAESADGIHWKKPDLGLYEFDGSKANNIVWDGIGSHNFTPFKDSNPNCPPEARYKALARGRSLRKDDTSSQHGLFAFESADGLHWKLMSDHPVITVGAFDSQNLAFFDPVDKVYRDYHRWFNQGKRDIMMATSKDFLNWTAPVGLKYTESTREHLYTNAIRRYPRAPHLFIGFPTRFLPEQGDRVEPVFMASRDGLHFLRWPHAVIPEDAPRDRRGNRSNYMTWGLVRLPGDDKHYSVYATEAYYTGPDSRVRRFTYRLDGFVAAQAGPDGGTLTTKPIIFRGNRLHVNVDTEHQGSLRAELQDTAGNPIDGFAFDQCEPLSGDLLDGAVTWEGNLETLSGNPVRIAFQLNAAKLYSFQFRP